MNRKSIAIVIAAAATAFAGGAFAESYDAQQVNFTSTKTRAEVQAELAAFQRAGVNPWSIQYNPVRYVQGTKARAQVVNEYLAARDQVNALTGEDSGSAYLAQQADNAVAGTADVQ